MRLGLVSARFGEPAAISIIDVLCEGSGLVAVSARLARVRIGHRRVALTTKVSSQPPQWIPRATPSLPAKGAAERAPKRRIWKLSDVAILLANALGKEQAEEVVNIEAVRLNLREPLETGDVLRLLGALSQSAGMVGTVAQFAKSRLMLSR
jgi:hypothetical protein